LIAPILFKKKKKKKALKKVLLKQRFEPLKRVSSRLDFISSMLHAILLIIVVVMLYRRKAAYPNPEPILSINRSHHFDTLNCDSEQRVK
jgi:hypothetical protein